VFFPAVTFAPGTQVGADQSYQVSAATGYFNVSLGRNRFLGQSPTLGFRVRLNGEFHYGYIQFDWRETVLDETVAFMYQPTLWAYETTPNTPITVPSVPAALAFGAAGIGAATLRRRPREE
jgi:MYXO-CTERM domain-containing protein